MPEPGYKTITVSEDLYEVLKKRAEKTHRSIAKLVEYLIDKDQSEEA